MIKSYSPHAPGDLVAEAPVTSADEVAKAFARARANGAERLVPIESAHADGCLYHGVAGLEFTERRVSLGARVRVRTTLNVGSLDLLHPGLVRADAEVAENGRRLMDAHVALGCEPTWSCAPYYDTALPIVQLAHDDLARLHTGARASVLAQSAPLAATVIVKSR